MPETERMVLRRTNWPDVDNIVALNADVEIMQHLGTGAPMQPAAVLSQEMPRLMAYNNRKDGLGFWIARERGTAEFLGWFMVAPVESSPSTVRVAYRLRSNPGQQGYGVEGMLNMIDIARAAEMTTVVAVTNEADLGSQQVLENAGLQRVDELPEEVELAVDHNGVEIRYLLSLS